MKTIKLLPVLALALGGVAAHADTTVFSEGFESFSALATNGWVMVNNSVTPVGNSWFAGNTGIFSAAEGTAGSYVAANYLSTAALTGGVSNWLITPQISMANGYSLSFKVRAAGAGYLDTLQVYLNGSGTTGTSAFTTMLGSYTSSVDEGWITKTFTISGLSAPSAARIGFLYSIADIATAGNYLGVDSVMLTSPVAVPEPASALLLALGAAGLAFAVRRR